MLKADHLGGQAGHVYIKQSHSSKRDIDKRRKRKITEDCD